MVQEMLQFKKTRYSKLMKNIDGPLPKIELNQTCLDEKYHPISFLWQRFRLLNNE